VLTLAASALVIGSLAWFAAGPLANVLCATAGTSLDQPTDTKLWTCRRACSLGSARDCVYYDELHNGEIKRMQRMLSASDAGPPPPVDVRADDAERAQSGCDDGDAGACGALGVLYAYGVAYDPLPDDGRARAAWARGCEGGHAASCTQLGNLDLRSSQPDPARALPLLARGCDGGDGLGCFLLAGAYERGEGVTMDLERSGDLYDRSCALGWSAGCASASEAFDHAGKTDRALDAALRGCLLDDSEGCYRLLQRATGPLPPAAVAVIERECAAEPTGPLSYRMGLRLIAGQGVDPDAVRGRAMFLRACYAGSTGPGGHAQCDSYARLAGATTEELMDEMLRILRDAGGLDAAADASR
jgi:TPR repeat protein